MGLDLFGLMLSQYSSSADFKTNTVHRNHKVLLVLLVALHP